MIFNTIGFALLFFLSGFSAFFIYQERGSSVAKVIFCLLPVAGVYFLNWGALLAWLPGLAVGWHLAVTADKDSAQHPAEELAIDAVNSIWEKKSPKRLIALVIVALATWYAYEEIRHGEWVRRPKEVRELRQLNAFQNWRYQECRNDAAKNPTAQGVNTALRVCKERFPDQLD